MICLTHFLHNLPCEGAEDDSYYNYTVCKQTTWSQYSVVGVALTYFDKIFTSGVLVRCRKLLQSAHDETGMSGLESEVAAL